MAVGDTRTRGGDTGRGGTTLELPGEAAAPPAPAAPAAAPAAPAAGGPLQLPGEQTTPPTAGDGQDLERWWNPVKSILKKYVPVLMPHVLNMMRAQAEAQSRSGDPRDIQVNVDEQVAQFQALLDPCLDLMVPMLIEQVVQENEARTSRGEPDDLSQQNIDRFWGAALAAGIPLLVENLPAITKEVGVAFSPGGAFGKGGFFSGLFGREYRARVDEQKLETAVAVVDTEMVARFWGPLTTVLGGCFQQAIPHIFKLIQGRGDPREYGISLHDLQVTNRLWDNDVIALVGIGGAADPNTTEFVLELAWHKSWWKGLQIRDDNGAPIGEIGVQDRNKVAEMAVPTDYFVHGGYLVFGKAKLFGAHTWMYQLSTNGMDNWKGQRLHYVWTAD
jgi:hypothetical protein